MTTSNTATGTGSAATPLAAVPTHSVGDGWRAVLDRLEDDVTTTERSLRDGEEPWLAPWSPPAVAGPIPPDLRARAADLLARQRDVVDQVVTRLAGNRSQRAMVDVVGRATSAPLRPAYLDVAL